MTDQQKLPVTVRLVIDDTNGLGFVKWLDEYSLGISIGYYDDRGISIVSEVEDRAAEWPKLQPGSPGLSYAYQVKVNLFLVGNSLRDPDRDGFFQQPRTIWFKVIPLRASVLEPRIEVTAWCVDHPSLREYFIVFMRAIAGNWRKTVKQMKKQGVEVGVAPPRGPEYATLQRAEVFKELKDAHPEWTMDRVAIEAALENPWMGDGITNETVRNAYRAMRRAYPHEAEAWTWQRGERTG